MKTDKIIYPLVVVYDRYTGTYSGGKWVALNCYPEDVPEAIFGDDSECFDFWMRWNERKGRSVIPIAVGNTCEEAIEKLREFIAMQRTNKHGEWVELYNYPDEWEVCHWVYKCSLCEYHTESLEDHCPNCGAKMTE